VTDHQANPVRPSTVRAVGGGGEQSARHTVAGFCANAWSSLIRLGSGPGLDRRTVLGRLGATIDLGEAAAGPAPFLPL